VRFVALEMQLLMQKTQAETQNFIIAKPCPLTLCFKPCSLTMIEEIDKAAWSLSSMITDGVATQWS
jgi:hypothetical protein